MSTEASKGGVLIYKEELAVFLEKTVIFINITVFSRNTANSSLYISTPPLEASVDIPIGYL